MVRDQPISSTGSNRSRTWLRVLLVLGLFGLNPLLAADVTATLNPTSVPAGEGAQLTIQILNGEPTALTAPEVPGLILDGPGEGRQISIVNGVRTSVMTLSYAVGSMTAGEYNIPPFKVTVDGAIVETPALKLTVIPSAAQTPAGLGQGGGKVPGGTPQPRSAAEENYGFLTVEFVNKQRRHAWVGEIAPVLIKAWLPADSRATLNSPLQPAGSSFTLHNLRQHPRQEREENNGKRYLTVSWFGGLSATKAGSYPPDLSMKVTIQVPDSSGKSRSARDLFGRQIQPMAQKEVELRSKTSRDAYLEIRPLPLEGKPGDFGGAVGKFSFGRKNIPVQWKTGEPQQIGVEVTGEGNFNLLRQPTLKSGKAWKFYEGQSSFAAGDAASFSGTTTWHFSQVPRQSGTQQVSLNVSYFDPDEATYQTIATEPQTIEVTGPDLPPEPAVASSPASSNAAPPPPALAPQRTREGMASRLTPFAWRRSFRTLGGALSLAVAAGLLYQFLQSRWKDPQRLASAAAEKALRRAMQEAETQAARGDVPGFFAAARRALQVRLGTLWQQPAPAITLADVTGRLPAESPVISFFREADRQEFCRQDAMPREELPIWRNRLEDALRTAQSS